MNIGWPEGIWLGLMALQFAIALTKNGQPRGEHDAGLSFIAILLGFGLLWWGGFFA